MDEIQDAAESFDTFEEWYAFIGKELKEFKEKMKEKKKENSVILSTMHRAKGLEWDEVYIVDCNEDIVPYYKATEQEDIEEERRMFYVAVTRARKILHICSIEKRNKTPMYLSRFVKEMKPPVETTTHTVDQGFKTPTTTVQFKPSMWVFHKTFGSGMITRVADGKVYIAFSDAGLKILEEKWCVANLQLF
jgi:DNA helicase-2/ATP-dependent DNA helicase PcrA